MANLRSIFLKGVETLFDTFEEAVHTGTYNLVDDDGFDTPIPATDSDVRCIFENKTEEDVEKLTFSKLIQPNDIIGLVPAVDITLEMSTQGYFELDSVRYTVEGHETDPMNVIYTILLRNN